MRFTRAMGAASVLLLAAGIQAVPSARTVANTDDVMEGRTPPTPSFPHLSPRPGVLRGFVRDALGRPLAGAKVLARSSAFGGFGTGTVGTSDVKGYYEVPLAAGVARVWCAGAVATCDGIRLVLPLNPADNELEDFTVQKGAVENFVVRTWGKVSDSAAADRPEYAGSYYGGAFTLGYSTREADDANSPSDWLVLGSTIELVLTPQGPLLDGRPGEALTIRQKVGPRGWFQVNDVPLGRYTIQARLTALDGKVSPLRLRDNSLRSAPGGLDPKQTDGAAILRFRSEGGEPQTIRPGGNLERLRLLVESVPKG